jgi:DNA polymerase-3 subunit alpha
VAFLADSAAAEREPFLAAAASRRAYDRRDPEPCDISILPRVVTAAGAEMLADVCRRIVSGSIERALERSRTASKDRERGQTNLFAMFGAAPPQPGAGKIASASDEYVTAAPWDVRETLTREKEALGFFVSGHPLDRYGIELARFEVAPTSQLAGMQVCMSG